MIMKKNLVLAVLTALLCSAPVNALIAMADSLQREYPGADTYSLTVMDDAVPLAGSAAMSYTSVYMLYAGFVIVLLFAGICIHRMIVAKKTQEAMEIEASDYMDDLIH